MSESKSLAIYIFSVLIALIIIAFALAPSKVHAASDMEEPVSNSYTEVI